MVIGYETKAVVYTKNVRGNLDFIQWLNKECEDGWEPWAMDGPDLDLRVVYLKRVTTGRYAEVIAAATELVGPDKPQCAFTMQQWERLVSAVRAL